MIRLTFIADGVRSAPEEFDTDDLGVALVEFGRSFSTEFPDAWVFAVAVERDDTRMSREAIIDNLSDIVKIEAFRARR